MRGLGTLASLGVVAALVVAAPRLAGTIEHARGGGGPDERLYYPDGPLLRYASLGFQAPVADLVWLQATQYYGGYRRGEHDLRYFDGLIDAVVTLDPRFVEAYHFASLVHSITHHNHAGAIDILKRGILANPDDWRLPFNIGFIHYVFLRQYEVAARWFEAAAALPGASDFCRRFAAFSLRRAGDLEGSLILWDHLHRTTDSQDVRDLAAHMIEQCQQALQGAPLENTIGPPSPRRGPAPEGRP